MQTLSIPFLIFPSEYFVTHKQSFFTFLPFGRKKDPVRQTFSLHLLHRVQFHYLLNFIKFSLFLKRKKKQQVRTMLHG